MQTMMRASLDKGNHCPDPLPVHLILTPEELHQLDLLSRDAIVEESPQHNSVRHKAEDIAHNKLRSQPPVEEAKVARVAQDGVHARRDEVVRVGLAGLDVVVEARAGLQHGHGADGLPDDDHSQARGDHQGRQAAGRPAPFGEEDADDEALEQGGGVGDGVGGPVGGEEEAVDAGDEGVAVGGGPELEEVEDGQGDQEEGRAPEGRVAAPEEERHGENEAR